MGLVGERSHFLGFLESIFLGILSLFLVSYWDKVIVDLVFKSVVVVLGGLVLVEGDEVLEEGKRFFTDFFVWSLRNGIEYFCVASCFDGGTGYDSSSSEMVWMVVSTMLAFEEVHMSAMICIGRRLEEVASKVVLKDCLVRCRDISLVLGGLH